MDINTFVNRYQGKIVSSPTGGYTGECVSLVKWWLKENGWPLLRGNAINWQYNGHKPYTFIKNYPWSVPKPGDMIIFSVGSYGHIGLVVSADSRHVQVFNQNWPTGHDTDPAKITTFDYVRPKCVGWLRYTGY